MANLATDIDERRCAAILNAVWWDDEDNDTNENLVKEASSNMLTSYCPFQVLKAVIALVFPNPDPTGAIATGCLNCQLRSHILKVSSTIYSIYNL